VADRPGHDRRYAIDCSKLSAAVGYAPDETLVTGLRRTVAWYLTNEAWWRGVLAGSYRSELPPRHGVVAV
jgi:dTDP-glucose 4,6-dehydratase